MAHEPRELMQEVRARRSRIPDAPSMLQLPVGGRAAIEPVRSHPLLQTMHEDWIRVHQDSPAARSTRQGWRSAVDRHVAEVARQSLGTDVESNRLLIGDVIRAADALAEHCDDLGRRLMDLEALVEDVVRVVSEDVTRLTAMLIGATEDAAGSSPAGAPDQAAPQTPGGNG